jgi:DNA-binding IclR family transcriptional regulator
MGAKRDQPVATGVQVLDRAVHLLAALRDSGEMTAQQLAAAVDEPRSTVYRLLSSLRAHGLVDVGTAPGSYVLGLELFTLGAGVPARFDLRRVALPVMERIHAMTEETVYLCVRHGGAGVCIERIDGLHVQSLALRVGGSLPLHAGGASMALLAHAPEEEWRAYAADGLAPLTPQTITSTKALVRALRETRERGYAVSDQDVTVGIAAIGAPVFDHRDRVVGALSLSGLRDLVLGSELERNRTLVVDGAREISRGLGSP